MNGLFIRLIVSGIIGWPASLVTRTGAHLRWLRVMTPVIGGIVVSSLTLSSLPGANVVGPLVPEVLGLTALSLGALICLPVANPHRWIIRR